MMTPEEAEKEMQRICDTWGGDKEAVHGKMDDFMCDLLSGMGYDRVVMIFERTEKWYA